MIIPGHVVTARALVDRPFRHRGRGPVWFDCLGLLVSAFAANGRQIEDREVYGREPVSDDLPAALAREFGPAVAGRPQIGDVGGFCYEGAVHHVGIFGNYRHGGLSLIHTCGATGKVVEQGFAESQWRQRLVLVHRP